MKTRREILQAGFAAGGLAVFSPLMFALQGKLGALTPPVMAGPFYPDVKPLDQDADLTMLAGKSQRASGQVVHVAGRVLDRNGDPVRNVKVELWQANAAGRYTHSADTSKAPLDPNFQGYGEQFTDAQGRFRFKTIKPGAYAVDANNTRTPHIHFDFAGKHDKVVTQMFFENEPLNEQDMLFKEITANRDGLVAKYVKNAPDIEAGALLVNWDVVVPRG